MKKLILSLMTLSTLSVVIAAPLSISNANAGEINVGGYRFSDGQNSKYAVYYKTKYQKRWQFKGDYGTRFEAEFAARRLEYNGYIARIDRY
jgi:hypothetical protein